MELVASPGIQARKLLFIARSTLESSDWASKIIGYLPDAGLSFLEGPPCIFRPIMPYLNEKSFQLSEDSVWVEEQLGEIIRWRESLATKYPSLPDYNWLLAVPSELLQPDHLLQGCLGNAIPIKYRIEAEAHFLKPVFEGIAKRHRDLEGRFFTLHVIGVDCFYHTDMQSAKDLADCFLGFRDTPELHPANNIEEDNSRCHHIEVDARLLNHTLSTLEKKFAKDAFFARIFLTKKAIGEIRTGSPANPVYVKPQKLLKQGDVIFWSVEGDNPALYWCKYGSRKLLEGEKRVLSEMRGGSPDIQKFLYEIHSFVSLEADYTAVLVSSHQGSYTNKPEEFETWLRLTKTSDNNFIEALKEIDQFFNILHIRPTDAEGFQDPKFLDSTGWVYEKLLTTKRTEPSRAITTPVRKDPSGKYKISDIRPRDSKGEVQIHLKKINTEDLIIVPWECSDWRWRLWKEGIGESERVNLELPVKSTRRHSSFLTERIKKYKNIFRCLDTALKDHIERNGRIKTSWIGKDLFPAWLHGDFHSRNVLLVPSNRGQIKTSDRGNWELKIIDLAYARVRWDKDERAPMAFDFVTFEVDMKAEGPFDLYSSTDFDEEKLLNSLESTEVGIWGWCRKVLPQCETTEWQPQNNVDDPGLWVPPESLPEWKIPEFSKVALWRHFSLFRLNAAAIKTWQGQKQPALNGWTPLKSYAQALFFQSIAYLAIRNPKDGKHRMQALSCLISAEIAARLLYDGVLTEKAM
jgi:hypothetical protein